MLLRFEFMNRYQHLNPLIEFVGKISWHLPILEEKNKRSHFAV
jgi:hypothetical protein